MVQIDGQPRDRVEDIKRLEVRSTQGRMVPLSQLATVHVREESATLDRLNLYPMVEITANPAPGEPLSAVRALCETAAAELPPECVLIWLEELPAPR